VGGLGDDILEGGAGNDTLNGGAGIDTASYATATAGVTVNLNLATAQNTVGAGTDTITTIENLTGSAFNDTLTGSSAANRIEGGAGNDILNGGLGNDIFVGGSGSDVFFFNSALSAGNIDTIVDFSGDVIRLENTGIFTALSTLGTLSSAAFVMGAGATTVDHRIVYNSGNGGLFYDADGSGSGVAVQFAIIGTGLNLSHSDFVVI
jgi:Ca2+-binding RTX toxin-like protein